MILQQTGCPGWKNIKWTKTTDEIERLETGKSEVKSRYCPICSVGLSSLCLVMWDNTEVKCSSVDFLVPIHQTRETDLASHQSPVCVWTMTEEWSVTCVLQFYGLRCHWDIISVVIITVLASSPATGVTRNFEPKLKCTNTKLENTRQQRQELCNFYEYWTLASQCSSVCTGTLGSYGPIVLAPAEGFGDPLPNLLLLSLKNI